MKNNKKIIILSLLVLMSVSIIGCGKNINKDVNDNDVNIEVDKDSVIEKDNLILSEENKESNKLDNNEEHKKLLKVKIIKMLTTLKMSAHQMGKA